MFCPVGKLNFCRGKKIRSTANLVLQGEIQMLCGSSCYSYNCMSDDPLNNTGVSFFPEGFQLLEISPGGRFKMLSFPV